MVWTFFCGPVALALFKTLIMSNVTIKFSCGVYVLVLLNCEIILKLHSGSLEYIIEESRKWIT